MMVKIAKKIFKVLGVIGRVFVGLFIALMFYVGVTVSKEEKLARENINSEVHRIENIDYFSDVDKNNKNDELIGKHVVIKGVIIGGIITEKSEGYSDIRISGGNTDFYISCSLYKPDKDLTIGMSVEVDGVLTSLNKRYGNLRRCVIISKVEQVVETEKDDLIKELGEANNEN